MMQMADLIIHNAAQVVTCASRGLLNGALPYAKWG